ARRQTDRQLHEPDDAVRVAAKPAKALALGSGITLLGVLRTLSEVNVEVIALPDIDRVTRRSRRYRSGPRALSGMNADTLARCLEVLPVPTVLIPCSDLWVRTVASLPAEVLSRYPSSIAPLPA